MTIGRRTGTVFLVAAAWTFYVWGFRLWVMWGDDHDLAFKVVHTLLALVSIGFAAFVGRVGWQARRGAGGDDGSIRAGREPVKAGNDR